MPVTCVTESKYIFPIVRNKFHIAYLPSAIVVAGITWLSLVKEVPVPVMGDIPLADKWGHMVAYMVLALCMCCDGRRVHLPVHILYLTAITIPLIYGGLIELIQPYFPPRQGEWADWLADGIGAMVGVLLFVLFQLWYNHRHPANDEQ
jgi:VanZ family protein